MDYSFDTWVKRRRKSLALRQPELAERTSCSFSLIFKIGADERRLLRQTPDEQRELFLEVSRQEKATDGLFSLVPDFTSQSASNQL